MIKAVIFDMDGLLIDSEPLWWEAEIETVKMVELYLTKEQTLETTGLKVDKVVEHWFNKKPWASPSKKKLRTPLSEILFLGLKQEALPSRAQEKFWNL